MLMKVVRWSNGMVMAFNEYGQQIPELQGVYTEQLASRIRRETTLETEFSVGDWRYGTRDQVTPEEWHNHVHPSP
jgi:hypothetical protein